MSDFQTEMNRVVAGFVAEITELARRVAINTLANALGGGNGRGHRAASPASSSRRGGKRSAEDLDRLRDQVLSFVTKNPGLRIEQINKELGTRTKDVALPIRKLIADGSLKTKGKKRSTTYFAK